MTDRLKKAVILAAGLGTRMRQASEAGTQAGTLTSEQAKMAASGVKALIPIGVNGSNRPFLDYVLTTLADVG
ncbi:MAG TPA: hypothetical protein PK402_08725, partial [Tepidisphaeraceae bacterium]|nr:hypothetical protein [Tepidisphaeraceae bacterium]